MQQKLEGSNFALEGCSQIKQSHSTTNKNDISTKLFT